MAKQRKRNKGKVLFVEDDAFISELFRQKFIIEGYKPIIAATAISAILALKEEKPTAIILDIVLPDSECWMILEYLRKRPDKINAPIILLTNWDNSEYKKKAKELKVDTFIIKSSTTPKELVRTMEDLINKYKIKGSKTKK